MGRKGSDRGVLVLLAVDDHKYRIEVGYGLEGILPDGKVGDIGREMVPDLRAGDYDGAVTLAVGESGPGHRRRRQYHARTTSWLPADQCARRPAPPRTGILVIVHVIFFGGFSTFFRFLGGFGLFGLWGLGLMSGGIVGRGRGGFGGGGGWRRRGLVAAAVSAACGRWRFWRRRRRRKLVEIQFRASSRVVAR